MDLSQRVFNFFHDNKGLPFRSMTVFNFLLEATLCGALLVLLVLLVRWLLRRKLGSRLVYFAWLLVAIRLLVPIALPNPLMNDLRPTLSTDIEARPIADQIRVRFQDAMDVLAQRLDVGNQLGTDNPSNLVSEALFTITAYTTYGWVGKWYLFAYLAVDGVLLCGVIVKNARFRNRLKKNRVGALTGDALEQYNRLCETHKMKPLPVYLVNGLPSACLVGVFKPYIALPASNANQPLALAHELYHHKMHDEWWGVLRVACCIVHWFNPLVWVGAHCARTDGEYACDERLCQAMADEQRLAYADTLARGANGKSTPGILVLATEITMREKRLKQRANGILHAHKTPGWAVAVFVGLAVIVLLSSFFTAESHGADYDYQLRKAIYNNLLDDPFPEVNETFNRMTVTAKPIANASDAITQANLYMSTSFLGNVDLGGDNPRYSVFHASEGWYVAATSSFDDAFCFLLGDDGQLIRYNSFVFDDQVMVNHGRLPKNIESAMAGYMTAFAEDCLGQTDVANPAINEDRYDVQRRYLACQADIGGETCGFLFCVAPYPKLLQFNTPVAKATAVTQENVLYSLWAYLRDELGITADRRTEACNFAVEWLEDSSRWQGTVRIPANEVGDATLGKLQALYGERAVYTLQMTCDVNGNGSDSLTAISTAEGSDAAVDTIQKETTTYFDTNLQLLSEEESISAGTAYTVLRTLTPAENRFEQVWAQGHTWLLIHYNSPAYGGWIERWILSPEEVIALKPGAVLGADGKPIGWRSAILSDAFWDKMEQIGGDDWKTASVLLQGWEEKYGDSTANWPLEGQALWGLWMNGIESSIQIPCLPEASDIPMESAKKIAREAFDKVWASTYPGEAIPATVEEQTSFLCDVEQHGQRIWYFQYIDTARDTGAYCGDVTLDAQTGEVLTSVASVGGNG